MRAACGDISSAESLEASFPMRVLAAGEFPMAQLTACLGPTGSPKPAPFR